MTNLDELYSADPAFHDIVVEAAAAAIGTTNPDFAEEWLALPVKDVDEMTLAAAYKAENESLREVILDAMTGYNANAPKPSITYPFATWVDTTKLPTNWDGTPKVTCSGIDPMFEQRTVVSE